MIPRLNEYVRQRLHETLNGREIDMFHETCEVPHMIGVTPIGEPHSRSKEDETILDPDHSFWEKHSENALTRREIAHKIERSIRILREKDVLELYYPYGEEADIVYVEVDGSPSIECLDCGSRETYSDQRTIPSGDAYELVIEVDCLDCEFSGEYGRRLSRR